MTFADLRQKLKSGEVSSKEIVQEKISRIRQLDPTLNSFLTVNSEEALKAAEYIDDRRVSGEHLPPLAGIPLAIKDNLCTKGIKTTCASKILGNFVPPYESTVTERLNRFLMDICWLSHLFDLAIHGTNIYCTKNIADLILLRNYV